MSGNCPCGTRARAFVSDLNDGIDGAAAVDSFSNDFVELVAMGLIQLLGARAGRIQEQARERNERPRYPPQLTEPFRHQITCRTDKSDVRNMNSYG